MLVKILGIYVEVVMSVIFGHLGAAEQENATISSPYTFYG